MDELYQIRFDETGFSNIWGDQKYINPEFFKVTIKQRFERSIYLKMFFSDINNSSRGEYY
jgi:hypothetical protein